MCRVLAVALLPLPLWGCAERKPAGDAPGLVAAEGLRPVASASEAAGAASPEAASAGAASPEAASASTSAPDPAAVPSAVPPRLYVRAHCLSIHAEPSLAGKWIGTLAAGDSVELRDEPPRKARSCASVRAVVPRGWVCADGAGATLDPDDAVWLALRAHAPDYTSPWPYRYGESRGARRHRSLPDVETPAWPPSLLDTHAAIAPRSTVAWLDEVDSGGATWLRASDMSFVRKDRVDPFEQVLFHGVALGNGARDAQLPLAFFKRAPHAKYRRDADRHLLPTEETWPRLAWIGLTGQTEKRGRTTYWETREDGTWIDARDAAIVAPDAGAVPAGPHPTWIEVAALQGWLVAYEGGTAVYATMISAGKLGAARPLPDDGEREARQPAATTPIGTFRIREKLLTATLQSDLDDGTEFVHAEVPWSQRFYDKYLLHTAYWHDRWGEGHSGGCVNLSPVDAKWLFEWTEPKVPAGWHAVRALEGDEAPATLVVIHP
jgi:lipoprotein-anchoring transpeptidase ErfK/SrfK